MKRRLALRRERLAIALVVINFSIVARLSFVTVPEVVNKKEPAVVNNRVALLVDTIPSTLPTLKRDSIPCDLV